HRIRVYTPYGQLLPGMAYLVRRLLENTSNDSFLKMSFADGLAEDLLLRSPSLNEGGGRKAEGGPVESNGSISMLANAVAETKSALRPPPSVFRNEPLADFARA